MTIIGFGKRPVVKVKENRIVPFIERNADRAIALLLSFLFGLLSTLTLKYLQWF